MLVEGYGFLGGMGTAAGVTNFCGLHANVYGRIEQVVHGVADELLDRRRRLGGLQRSRDLLFGGKIAACRGVRQRGLAKVAAEPEIGALASGDRTAARFVRRPWSAR